MHLKNKQRGIGLLELMLSLAIIAAIILMATRYFMQASEASKVSQATETVSTLINASYKWLEGEPNFLGTDNKISIQQLVDKGILPPDWSDKKAPWPAPNSKNNSITLDPYGSKNNQIQITIPGAPKSACDSINDVMVKQGVQDFGASCSDTSGYQAIYPKEPPY